MIEADEFKEWLNKNSSYSDAVITDTVSRMKRADCILEWKEEEVYQFYLERTEEYKQLSSSVRSQIKRAVKWYFAFCKAKDIKLNN
jgi:DNA (cytosine-5)-methyltransferase 1